MMSRIWPGLMMKLFELFCNVSDQSFSLVKMNSSPFSLTSLGEAKQNLHLQSHQLSIQLVHQQSGQPQASYY